MLSSFTAKMTGLSTPRPLTLIHSVIVLPVVVAGAACAWDAAACPVVGVHRRDPAGVVETSCVV